MSDLSLIELSVVRDGKAIINTLNADFRQRSINLLTGANGSGKSTLLSTIAGDITPTSGDIQFDGLSLLKLPLTKAAKIRCYMQQRNEFTLNYRVREFLEMVIRHCARTSPTRNLEELATELDLTHLLTRPVLEISEGERQRVFLAMTLVRRLGLYLLDEPLSAQDQERCKRISLYLGRMAQDGATFVIATHQIQELATLATKVHTLDRF